MPNIFSAPVAERSGAICLLLEVRLLVPTCVQRLRDGFGGDTILSADSHAAGVQRLGRGRAPVDLAGSVRPRGGSSVMTVPPHPTGGDEGHPNP
jgi:hypothetical protein